MLGDLRRSVITLVFFLSGCQGIFFFSLIIDLLSLSQDLSLSLGIFFVGLFFPSVAFGHLLVPASYLRVSTLCDTLLLSLPSLPLPALDPRYDCGGGDRRRRLCGSRFVIPRHSQSHP